MADGVVALRDRLMRGPLDLRVDGFEQFHRIACRFERDGDDPDHDAWIVEVDGVNYRNAFTFFRDEAGSAGEAIVQMFLWWRENARLNDRDPNSPAGLQEWMREVEPWEDGPT